MLKFGNKNKRRFYLEVQRGDIGFEPSRMILYLIIYYFWRVRDRDQKMPFHFLKNVIFKLFRGPGIPEWKNYAKKGSKGSSHLILKRHSLCCWTPSPSQIGLKDPDTFFTFHWQLNCHWIKRQKNTMWLKHMDKKKLWNNSVRLFCFKRIFNFF